MLAAGLVSAVWGTRLTPKSTTSLVPSSPALGVPGPVLLHSCDRSQLVSPAAHKENAMKPIHDVPDLATITGHFHAKRALEVAACGGHSLALIGGPGNGKTLLARALPGLVPPCEDAQARPIVEGQEAMAWVEEALQGH